MKKRKNATRITISDYLKAARSGARIAEREVFGDGFHATDRPHRSKKTYTRKKKHPGRPEQ